MDDLIALFTDDGNEPYKLVPSSDVTPLQNEQIEYENTTWKRNGSWHRANIGSGEVMGDPHPDRPRYDRI